MSLPAAGDGAVGAHQGAFPLVVLPGEQLHIISGENGRYFAPLQVLQHP